MDESKVPLTKGDDYVDETVMKMAEKLLIFEQGKKEEPMEAMTAPKTLQTRDPSQD